MAAAGADLSTVGILGAVVLLEGLRKVPAGAVVLRRFPWTAWRVALVESERPRLRLVSWWPPLSRSLVLSAGGADPSPDVPQVLNRARAWALALEAAGLVALLGLVVGVPLATSRAGAFGLIASVGGVFVWSLAIAAASGLALERMGFPWRNALRDSLPLLSPFAASGAAERVLQRVLAGNSPLAVAEAVLPADAFAAWIRPRAYDLVRRAVTDAELEALHPREHWNAVAAAPPAGGGAGDAAYCPRCGAWYRNETASCADCEGVALQQTLRR